MDRSSKNRLNKRHIDLFPGHSLFDKIARSVCLAECLPRKELYESWETARRVHRRLKGRKVIEVGCGHGLLSQLLILLDNSIPEAIALDPDIPPSAARLSKALAGQWPRLANRVRFIRTTLDRIDLQGSELLVSAHGCGELTDQIIAAAIANNNPVALLPCCHDLKNSDTAGLEGWLEPTLAVDINRVFKLKSAGYNVMTGSIPGDITPKNRLIIALPEQ